MDDETRAAFAALNRKVDDNGAALTALDRKVDDTAAALNLKIDDMAAGLNRKIDDTAAALNLKIDDTAAGLNRKIDDTAAALNLKVDDTRTTMAAGFARMEHYFELQQAQFLEFRAEVRTGFREVHAELAALTRRVEKLELEMVETRADLASLRQEVRGLRDWITRELADLKQELGMLQRTPTAPEVQRDIDDLRARVDRIEQRLREPL